MSVGPVEQGALDRLLSQAEAQIGLLDRARPRNLQAVRGRLVAEWRVPREPGWAYTRRPDLGALRRALDGVVEHLQSETDPWTTLYRERLAELAEEAGLVEAVGTPAFRGLASMRYPAGPGPEFQQATAWAEEWLSEPPGVGSQPQHISDDARDPDSLISQLGREIGSRRLPLRVVVSPRLQSKAACAEGVIFVRPGVLSSQDEGQRLVRHEIEGHALPQLEAARSGSGLLMAGLARGLDDQEGRALLIERRAGLLGSERRRELALRHVAASAVRQGGEYVDVARLLAGLGVAANVGVAIAERVLRGGGLAREIVYLPALSRVASALERDPELEIWLRRGRVSVAGARLLASRRCLGPLDGLLARSTSSVREAAVL